MKRLSDVQLNGMEIKNSRLSVGHSRDDQIQSFKELTEEYQQHLSKYLVSWNVIIDKVIVFYKMDISSCPKIVTSIKIEDDLTITVFTDNGKITEDCLELFLNSNNALTHWTQLRNLLIYFGSESALSYRKSPDYYITEAKKLLNCCMETITDEDDYSTSIKRKLRFLSDQLSLFKKRKYSQFTTEVAYSIYLKSSTCYKAIRKLDILNLPNEKELLRIISSTVLDESSDDELSNK